MSNKKNIASILMLGATTVGLTGSTSTSAGLFDFLNWKEAKARDDNKEAQGYETAKNVAKIFLEHFGNDNKKTSDEKNKDKNNVMAILEDLVLEKFSEEELVGFYKEKFKNMTQKLNLSKENIAESLDNVTSVTTVESTIKTKDSKDTTTLKSEKKESLDELNNKEKNENHTENQSKNEKNVAEDAAPNKKRKFPFLGCLGKAIGSLKGTIVGKSATFDLTLYENSSSVNGDNLVNANKNGEGNSKEVNVTIEYKKASDLKKYMSELEEKLLKTGSSEKNKGIFDFKIKQIETLIEKAKSKGISYEKIINTFFKKLDVKGGGLLFSNNPLTETLWKKSSKNSEIVGGEVRVLELRDEDKEILHELGYEKNNSRVLKGVRWGVSIGLTSAVVAGLSAAFPVIAGIAAAPIGVALTGVVATVVDRVAFKTRFKEYRKIESWNPKNWEVQRFLKDTVRNTITSAMWALSVTPILSSIF